MEELSIKAKLYITGIILTGVGISIWQLRFLDMGSLLTLIVISVLGIITQVKNTYGPTARSSYSISWMIFGFAIMNLGLPGTLVVILVSHIVAWVWRRYPYYIQLFNISNYAIAAFCAAILYDLIRTSSSLMSVLDVLGIVVSMAVFTFINHFLVGVVIKFARGQNFSESGVFGSLTLAIDFTLLCLGGASAMLWESSPYVALLPLIPLYLIYKVLRLPALERETQQDAKTGLINHKYFMEAFERELASANRFDRPLTIVMADMDLLRNINNNYGHVAGDEVIISLAQILKESFRWHDVVGRFGGEEFCALLPDSSPEEVFERVDSIRRTIAETDFEVSTSVTPIKVTMSFGIAGRDAQAQTSKDITHNADLALYQAKNTGRNRVCVYTSDGVQNASATAEAEEKSSLALPEEKVRMPEEKMHPQEGRARQPDESPALPASPKVHSQPVASQRWLNAYIGIVGVAALALMALFIRPDANLDWFGLGIFTIVVFLTEWFAVEVYDKDTTVSTSAAPYIAGILILGPVGAMVLSIALAIAALSHHRKHLKRLIFNICNHLVAGLLCAGLIDVFRLSFFSQPFFAQFSISVAVAMFVYLETTFLVTVALHLDSGQPIKAIWVERFRWLAASYVSFGLVAFLFILSYQHVGILGVIAVLAPIFMLRHSQALFIERTRTVVSELKKANVQLEQRVKENAGLSEELLLVMARVSEMRDPYVMGHSQHVARYAVLIADELGLPAEKVEQIRKAALLHDIGKLGIGDVILFKPSALTAEEYEAVKLHSKMGADLLDVCHSLRELMAFILHHHERYDGRGYPDGLQGEEIPLEARILGLADAVEAMSSDRHYRPAHEIKSVLSEIQAEAGLQFDPEVVKAFLRVVEKKGENVVINSAREIEADNLARATHGHASIFSISDQVDVYQRLMNSY